MTTPICVFEDPTVIDLNRCIPTTYGYRNDRAGITQTEIASQTAFDLAYATAVAPGLDLRVEAINLTDRDPPLAQFAFAYDPIVADPRGRIVSLTLTQRF